MLGIIFELAYYLLETKANLEWDVLLATLVSFTLLPIILTSLVDYNSLWVQSLGLLNLTLLALLVSSLSAILMFIFSQYIQQHKWFLRLRHE